MKFHQWVFKILKKQNVTYGRTHGRTHRRMNGQRENSIPPLKLRFGRGGGIKSIYFCILFCDRGRGKCCCISKIQFFRDARYVVYSVFVSVHCRRANVDKHNSLYNALSKEFAIEIMLKNVAKEEMEKKL